MALLPENIIFNLKRSLLEYSLRHRIESIVYNFALNQKSSFSSFNISSIRFELFSMFILVKHKKLDRFDSAISFLNEFNTKFPSIIPEQLFNRVQTSLKALKIFDCLRNGDCKKTVSLIKEYFSDKNFKTPMETKIIKLRAIWNELILDKSKRDLFFETKFKLQYDDKFLKFLLLKTIEIINIISDILPITQFDELMINNFKNLYFVLFKNNQEIEFELEDGVRFDLFLDNLKLHHIQLQAPNQENINPKKKSCFTNLNSNVTNIKYLRKIFKVLINWENAKNTNQDKSDSTQPNQSMDTETQIKTLVHEMLYMDSLFDQFKYTQTDDEQENGMNYLKNDKLNFQNNNNLNKKAPDINEPININEIITDDEKDSNLSI